MKCKHIHIVCKRWFQKTYGNTYHSVEIRINQVPQAYSTMHYGYEEHCLRTACFMLIENNFIDTDKYKESNHYSKILLENNITHEIIDVDRKKDL